MGNFEQDFQNKLVPQNNYGLRILIIFSKKISKKPQNAESFFIFEKLLQGFYFGHLILQKIPI